MVDEKRIKEEIDDYEYTLQTLAAISNILEFNFRATNTQGKTMTTSDNNSIQPNTEITPDLVSELDGSVQNMENCGLVTEIKVDLPKDQQYWEAPVSQLKKYDDELSGWNSRDIAYRDILFVTNVMRTYDFSQYLKSTQIQNKYPFNRNLSVLNSSRMQQSNTFMLIKKEDGKLENPNLDQMMTRGVAVPWTVIIPIINEMKFYDSKPPVIYTMMIIWDHILKTYIDQKQRRELGRKRMIEILVHVEDITGKLSIYAPRTNSHCIKQEWIREALDEFERIDLAKLVNRDTGAYRIKMTMHKGDLRDWIMTKFKELEAKKSLTLDKFLNK